MEPLVSSDRHAQAELIFIHQPDGSVTLIPEIGDPAHHIPAHYWDAATKGGAVLRRQAPPAGLSPAWSGRTRSLRGWSGGWNKENTDKRSRVVPQRSSAPCSSGRTDENLRTCST